MVSLTALWLPILLSAVAVFVASSIIHMLLPYHRSDYAPVPAEDQLMDDLRRAGLAPGQYVVPHAPTPKAMSSPEFQEKVKRGPVAFLTVMRGAPGMGKQLALWFVYLLAVSVVAAYVASRALAPDADYLEVFRFTGTTAFAAYVLGNWPEFVWWGRRLSTTLKTSFDGLVYALLTAGVFGWLW